MLLKKYILEKLVENSNNNIKEEGKKIAAKIDEVLEYYNVNIEEVTSSYDNSSKLAVIDEVKFSFTRNSVSNELIFVPKRNAKHESIEFYKDALSFLLVSIDKRNKNLANSSLLNVSSSDRDNIILNQVKNNSSMRITVVKLFRILFPFKEKVFDEWAKNQNYKDFSFYLSYNNVKSQIENNIIPVGKIFTENIRDCVVIKDTATFGNIAFYKRSGDGAPPSGGISETRNDTGEGCWIPFGGLGTNPSKSRLAWISKIPSGLPATSKLSGGKFVKQFSELYYIGIALTFIESSINIPNNNNKIANTYNLKNDNMFYKIINDLNDDIPSFLKLKPTYITNKLIKNYHNMLINKLLKEEEALKVDWFSSQGSEPIDTQGGATKILNLSDEKKTKFWINALKIYDIDQFDDFLKSYENSSLDDKEKILRNKLRNA